MVWAGFVAFIAVLFVAAISFPVAEMAPWEIDEYDYGDDQ